MNLSKRQFDIIQEMGYFDAVSEYPWKDPITSRNRINCMYCKMFLLKKNVFSFGFGVLVNNRTEGFYVYINIPILNILMQPCESLNNQNFLGLFSSLLRELLKVFTEIKMLGWTWGFPQKIGICGKFYMEHCPGFSLHHNLWLLDELLLKEYWNPNNL